MIKKWKELVPPDHACHISVELNEERMPLAYHGHDFAEVFWVEEGVGTHTINNTRISIESGDIIFIRPSDYHSLASKRGIICRLQNVAFPKMTLQRIYRSYFKEATFWPWRQGKLPYSARLMVDQISILNREVTLLAHSRKDRLALDCFLLNLFRLLGHNTRTHHEFPDWLDAAMRNFASDHTNLQAGLPRLIQLASRSPEHVARVVKSCCGRTPSSWVNQCRLEFAARQIETRFAPIGEIAAEAGFENQSYFQKLFFKQYKITPLKYRQRHRQVM